MTNTNKDHDLILTIHLNRPEEIETMFQVGLAAGGKDRSPPLSPEEAMMQYYRLEDLDGHLRETCYMKTNS